MRFLNEDVREVASSASGKREIQVIGAGLPRTATSSLQEALESKWLGFGPSFHMAEVAPNAERRQLVLKAMVEKDNEKRYKLLRKLMEGFVATTDFPGVLFTADLMDMYPEAKIVLNQRTSAEAWRKSMHEALDFFASSTYWYTTCLFQMDREHHQMQTVARQVFPEQLRAADPSLPASLEFTTPEFYTAYNDYVRSEAKKRGRAVLEWQPKDGWEPLCKFLGKPTPPADVPFPHKNDKNDMQILKAILVARGLVGWVALVATVAAGVRYGPDLLAYARELIKM